VVLIDFWTYSCINCLRFIPYVQAWAEKCKDAGLVVIGVHAPEFAFEKSIANVKAAVGRLGITYPVAPSTTATGRRIISSMRKAAFAIIISARGSMSARSASSSEQRLYQLIRQTGPIRERTFEICFLDPGVHAYAFTFG